jgi:impB/mucB/samB family/Pyridine nucleotide-disulphide oxidoreductase/Reductase C-terminal
MSLRKIIHVDMDAFYASVEQRDNPALRGRPVAVGHGAKRGVVAAASYEARAFGVRSAMPSTTVMRQCAELVFVPPRFDVYRAVSRQIHAIFAEYASLIEPLALDEAYLDVTENRRGLPTASATAKAIRTRILEDTALTASAGISYNKFLAKLVSMERVMGAAIGDMVRAIHESHGVNFHLGATVTAIAQDFVKLSSGERLPADLVVVGIGVRPAVTLAMQAGLTVDRGVVVDEFLQTSMADIYAAGDIARWPDKLSEQRIRVEHWVVAQRQGQVAARNMLGLRQRFDAVPFFWSQHYGTTIAYVGHAEQWDRLDIDGDPAAHDCAISFWRNGRKLAMATVGRDLDNLRAEAAFEQAPGV